MTASILTIRSALVIIGVGLLAGSAQAQSIYGSQPSNGGMYGSPPSNGGMYNPGIGNGFGTGSNQSAHSVQGYTTNNGTYVQPHLQTNPNNTQMDNYGTRGNFNPNTGAFGTRTPRY